MYLVSLISPLGLFISYFFNACIAHNLFITFYTYKNNFDNRMRVYKISALIGGIVTLILSIMFNNRTNLKSVKFTVGYYPFYFLGFFYFAGGLLILYMILKMAYVINHRRNSVLNFLSSTEDIEGKHNVVSLLVRRHLSFCFTFLICFVPNNVILILQLFMSYKLCDKCVNYSIIVYLMSLSCTISFAIKMTEPYMKKYLNVIVKLILRKDIQEEHTDYTDIYSDNPMIDKNQNEKEMAVFGSPDSKKKESRISTGGLDKMADSLLYVTKEMEIADFFVRMIGIITAINEDLNLDYDPTYMNKMKAYLPWEDHYYTHKSDKKEYTEKNIPDFLKTKETSELKMRVKVRKYAPKVFCHLIKIDGLSINELMASLDPEKNLKLIKESFASGGRSANPIIFTHDKKFLLKTISKLEKNIFVKMLQEYHRRMRDCSSYLCRIYGIYRIKISSKEDAHIIIMKNMNELPSDTKILVFDLKGSTVDRSALDAKDREMIENGKSSEVIAKYKKKVLKDLDFSDLKFQFKLNKKDAHFLQTNMCSDAEFLRGYNLMDYSCLLSVHKYTPEDESRHSHNPRVMISTDKDYIYNFSIIDFLSDYNIMKIAEKYGKKVVNNLKGASDNNTSVQNSIDYSRRFVRFITSNIQEQDI